MKFRLTICAFVFTACIAPQPTLVPPTGEDVTVFVHGYKGGFLKTESGELAWITVGEALSKGERSLALPFNGQHASKTFGPLTPAGPMTRLTAIPLLFEEEVYARWMNWAKDALPGFITWSYDWRLDLRETGAGLCSFIESLGPHRRVRIVAHSMGGLVALQCLRRGPRGSALGGEEGGVSRHAVQGRPRAVGRSAPGHEDDLEHEAARGRGFADDAGRVAVAAA